MPFTHGKTFKNDSFDARIIKGRVNIDVAKAIPARMGIALFFLGFGLNNQYPPTKYDKANNQLVNMRRAFQTV